MIVAREVLVDTGFMIVCIFSDKDEFVFVAFFHQIAIVLVFVNKRRGITDFERSVPAGYAVRIARIGRTTDPDAGRRRKQDIIRSKDGHVDVARHSEIDRRILHDVELINADRIVIAVNLFVFCTRVDDRPGVVQHREFSVFRKHGDRFAFQTFGRVLDDTRIAVNDGVTYNDVADGEDPVPIGFRRYRDAFIRTQRDVHGDTSFQIHVAVRQNSFDLVRSRSADHIEFCILPFNADEPVFVVDHRISHVILSVAYPAVIVATSADGGVPCNIDDQPAFRGIIGNTDTEDLTVKISSFSVLRFDLAVTVKVNGIARAVERQHAGMIVEFRNLYGVFAVFRRMKEINIFSDVALPVRYGVIIIRMFGIQTEPRVSTVKLSAFEIVGSGVRNVQFNHIDYGFGNVFLVFRPSDREGFGSILHTVEDDHETILHHFPNVFLAVVESHVTDCRNRKIDPRVLICI